MTTPAKDELDILKENIKNRFDSHIYAILLSTVGFSYGVALLMFNAFMKLYLLQVHQIDTELPENAHKVKWIKNCVNFGLFFGCTTACGIGNFLYKRLGGYRLSIYNLVFYILTAGLMTVKNLYTLVLARYLQGISVYLWTILIPILLKDNLPLSLSEPYNIVYCIAIDLGALIGSGFGYEFCGKYWYLVILLPVPFDLIRLIVMFFYKMESPRWLIERGKKESEVKENFLRFYEEPEAEQMAAVLEKRRKAQEKEAGFWDLFTPRYRLQFSVLLVLSLLNQFTGMNIITMFSADIFENNGMKGYGEILTNILGVVMLLGDVANIFLLDPMGKRGLFIWGLFGQAFGYCFFFLGLALGVAWLNVIGIYIGTFCYIMSVGGLLFSYASDALPPVGRFTVALIQWVFACILIATAQDIEARFGAARMFLVAQLCAVFGGIYYIGYGVETAQKSELVIEKEFQNKRFFRH